jgi:hypothetical protein
MGLIVFLYIDGALQFLCALVQLFQPNFYNTSPPRSLGVLELLPGDAHPFSQQCTLFTSARLYGPYHRTPIGWISRYPEHQITRNLKEVARFRITRHECNLYHSLLAGVRFCTQRSSLRLLIHLVSIWHTCAVCYEGNARQ